MTACALLVAVLALPGPTRAAAGTDRVDTTPAAARPPRPEPSDERRVGRRFLANLGRNTVGVFARENLRPFLIGAGATGLGAFFDDDVERYFEARRRAPWLGDTGDTAGQPQVLLPLAVALYGSGRLAQGQRYRDTTYDIAQVYLLTAGYATALKYAVGRERPHSTNTQSFPSGHAADAFAWATVASLHYGPRVGVPLYVAAGLVGVSRLEKDAHHLSDVLAGATLGYVLGHTVVRGDGRPLGGTRVQVLALPGPGGLDLEVSF